MFGYHHVADRARHRLDVEFGVEVAPSFIGADGVTRRDTCRYRRLGYAWGDGAIRDLALSKLDLLVCSWRA